MTRYRVRADKRLLYRGKRAERAYKVFFKAAREPAYSQANIVLLVNGQLQAKLFPRPVIVSQLPASDPYGSQDANIQ
ncbi:hypothetical protein EPA93_01700 [Ktedonosporobacter rubrisoli]|uniref:Uncharacterized protein n=1 Tax=Ktedonosporobacter rubrisoli TaxID=2509675 RepID=A0A4P6JI93_KTERU|nr:hypothetical protein [Ktedonosporobacter rubrisoli]QBD74774.1 hypothetical protein EPA93_01700 [Ktedonosporobacter rubrisoli]